MKRAIVLAACGVLGGWNVRAKAQAGPPQDLPMKPPPVPGGVIPLPQGAPPSGLQAPLPAPPQELPISDRPLLVSPGLGAIKGYVDNRPITLQDAVAIALYTSRGLAASVASLQRAQARTGQARVAFNPTVGINSQLTEYDAPTTAAFTIPGAAQTPPPIVITPQFNPIIITTFSLPIDISGTLRSAVSQAQFNEVAARIEVNRVRNQLVYEVKTAFYGALRAQAQVAVATDSLNNSLSRLDFANKNYVAGTSPRFDVISAQRDVADAQRALIDARSQVSLSLTALKNTTGIDLRSRLRLTDANAVENPPGVAPVAVPPPGAGAIVPTPAPPAGDIPANDTVPTPITRLPIPPTDVVEDTMELGPELDALRQEALRTRPEILEGDAQIAAARRGFQYARRSSLPALSFSLGYTYMPNASGFARTNQGAAILGLNLPLFDGGLARERVKEARADVAAAEVNRRQAQDQVQVDVQQAYITLVEARNRVAMANVGLAQAREAQRLAQVRYNAGVSQQTGISPQLELSNAQTSLTQAQTNQVNALYDYNNARAQLDRAVGRYSYAPAGPGYSSAHSVPIPR